MQTPAITLWFLEQCLFWFFILEKQLASQDMFLIRSKLSITAYLFLVLYIYIFIVTIVSKKYQDLSVQVEIGE
jgi:hypothetical protein